MISKYPVSMKEINPQTGLPGGAKLREVALDSEINACRAMGGADHGDFHGTLVGKTMGTWRFFLPLMHHMASTGFNRSKQKGGVEPLFWVEPIIFVDYIG